MLNPLTELFLIGFLVGLILGLVLGMLLGTVLSRWHHAQAMHHLAQMAATPTTSHMTRPRHTGNPYDHSVRDEDIADLYH